MPWQAPMPSSPSSRPSSRGSKGPVSLENFNEDAPKLALTSPRSIEALRVLGVEPDLLLKR